MQSAPKSIQNGVISRLKIMSDIDIAERRKPQDGRMSVVHGGRQIDLRVATLPTVWGEKVVMRILDNSNTSMTLRDLNLLERNFETFQTAYSKPYGMILVTGPTGSGKSTTLYTTLNAVARPEINVITVEDPVEYRMPGINQVQVNPKAGLTFASALRSILRTDPDVVLLGEIRDHETAQIAIEASLTGHLVLSTLHTNDAPSAITRLTEMDIEPFLVGSALDCVVAQRLARRLCDRCKQRRRRTRPRTCAACASPSRPTSALADRLRPDRLHRLLEHRLPRPSSRCTRSWPSPRRSSVSPSPAPPAPRSAGPRASRGCSRCARTAGRRPSSASLPSTRF